MPETPDTQERLRRLKESLLVLSKKNYSGPSEPDSKTLEESEDLEKQHKKTEIEGLSQDIAERKRYALFFFVLACAWVVIITGLVFCQGVSAWGFKLSEPVVLALIGSTTVNILGIMYVVANYLFPKR